MLIWLNPGMIVGTIAMIKLIAHDPGSCFAIHACNGSVLVVFGHGSS